jgi:hypothetical protein
MPSANKDPQGSTEASRVYSVILQRQSLDYIRHALNMYFRFPFFLSFLKFEIFVNKGSSVAITLSTPLTLSQTSVNRHTLGDSQSVSQSISQLINQLVSYQLISQLISQSVSQLIS